MNANQVRGVCSSCGAGLKYPVEIGGKIFGVTCAEKVLGITDIPHQFKGDYTKYKLEKQENQETQNKARVYGENYEFGYLVGKPIEGSEIKSLYWYWEQTGNKVALTQLTEIYGYSFVGDSLLSPERRAEIKEKNEIYSYLEGTNVVSFVSNFNSYGQIKVTTPRIENSSIDYAVLTSKSKLQRKDYNGYEYFTIGHTNSMKKGKWVITVENSEIKDIHTFVPVEVRKKLTFSVCGSFETEKGQHFYLLVDGTKVEYKGFCKLRDVLENAKPDDSFCLTATIVDNGNKQYELKKPTKAKKIN